MKSSQFLCTFTGLLIGLAVSTGLRRHDDTSPITATIGCSHQQAKDVRDAALTLAQIACVFSSTITDEAIVAKTCGIVDKLPFVRNLIGQREGARRAGVVWTTPDAGAGDAGSSDAGTQ